MPSGDLSIHAGNVQRSLLREHKGLQPCNPDDELDPLVVYPDESGEPIFTFCLNGLLVPMVDGKRHIPYTDIADTSYINPELLEQEKDGPGTASLTILLVSGEKIELALRQRQDRFSERLAIARIIKNRVARAKL